MDTLKSFSSRAPKGKGKRAQKAPAAPPPPQDQDWRLQLLERINVRTHLRGRIRFHLDFPGDESLGDSLRRELHKETSVRLASYSIRTRTALVTFDPAQTTELRVMESLLGGVMEYARLHGECALENHTHEVHNHHHHHEEEESCPEEHCDHDHSAMASDAGIRKELLKLVITGGALGYFLYKRVQGKPALASGQGFMDMKALLTVAAGYPIFRSGFKSVQNGKKPTDDTLISIAVIASLLMGESLTGLSVVWLINLGRLLEVITLKRSRTAIKDLMDIAPNEAWVVQDGKTPKRVAVEKIGKKQTIRVFHGEKVPLDGKVIRGEGYLKEAFITGEALPRKKAEGDTVYAGSLVDSGEIDIEVTSLVNDTVVARIIHAIENIRDTKAPIEKVGTRFASSFVPISLGLFGVTLLLTGDMRRAITMLVIACPCAAGLATPTAVSASIGQAARRGILIKGGTHIEAAAHVDTIVFDKTGTLTSGNPELVEFLEAGNSGGMEECLRVAASAEQHTTHPLGLVLLREAKKRSLPLLPIKKYVTHAGQGIFAEVEGRAVHIGNRGFMESLHIKGAGSLEAKAMKKFVAGESIVYLAMDEALCGAFLVQDALRPEARQVMDRMRKLGVKRILLATGDQKIAADYIARQLGITEVFAELLPADKLALISRLKSEGCRVGMVGDGVNDAQALAQADLSIAMGAGRCDVAMESADVTLARNDLLLAADVLEISQKTLRTIFQNFAASVGINIGGIGFSMLGKMTPFSAAIVHNASTIAVVLNSLRLGKEVGERVP